MPDKHGKSATVATGQTKGFEKKMLSKRVLALAISVFICFSSLTSSAVTINSNGFDVEVFHEPAGDVLRVWGKVNGGPECRELQLTILMKDQSARIAKTVATIRGYSGGWPGPYTFKGTGDLVKDKKKKKIILKPKPGDERWFLDDVEAKCLK